MKFSLSWLREHLQGNYSLEDVTAALTTIGMEVETVHNPAAGLKPFTAARVIAAEKHPQADRLRVCQLETNAGPVQVVCGAKNAIAGLVGVFAPAGVKIPESQLVLKRSTIRGVESAGMLCSERELLISGDHDRIIELSEDVAVGTPVAPLLGLDDAHIDVSTPANRCDLLGVRGIAADLAAYGIGDLVPDVFDQPIPVQCASDIAVRLEFDDDRPSCRLFIGREIRNVKNGPSPSWLVRRIEDAGGQSINRIVDITNLLAFDRARPMHAYDASKLCGDLVVRRAREIDEFDALNGHTLKIQPGDCVIEDASGIVGLGGILGGVSTSCDEDTSSVFLESAWFDPAEIALTRRRLNVQSDAAFRFERSVDPGSAQLGIEIATRLVLDLCGGQPGDEVVAGEKPNFDVLIELPPGEVKRLTGLTLDVIEIQHHLQALGCIVHRDRNQFLHVSPPGWRPDLTIKADLVEEVLRMVGVDQIEARPPGVFLAVGPGVRDLRTRREMYVRRKLATRGLYEAVRWSFVAKEQARVFRTAPPLELSNPISIEMAAMRPSLLPGLIGAAARNCRHGASSINLFEVGAVFHSLESNGQRSHAAGIRVGESTRERLGRRHWVRGSGVTGLWAAKDDAIAALDSCGAPTAGLTIDRKTAPWYHPGRSGRLMLGSTPLGMFGELHPEFLEKLDLSPPVSGFEVDLSSIPVPRSRKKTSRPEFRARKFLPLYRDVAFVLAKDVPASALISAIRKGGRSALADVTIFDVYEGPKIGKGEKSIAVELEIAQSDQPLQDAEIHAVVERVIERVGRDTGARVR